LEAVNTLRHALRQGSVAPAKDRWELDKMGLRAFAVGLAMFGFAATGALAQEGGDHDQRLLVAREIVTLRSDEASDMTMLQAKAPYFTASIASVTHLSDGERAALPAMLERAYRAVRVPAHEQVAATYARIFTLAQLQQLLAFYQSDAGKAFLSHQQELTTEGINLQRLSDAAVISSVVHTIDDQRRGAAQ
jgi:hypothetical protein